MAYDAALIKQSVDIRDVAALYGVEPDNRGMCTCPFHDDRHPSASFKNGRFHCFVCDIHADIFEFVQRMTGCDFKNAMRLINDAFRIMDADQPVTDEHRAEMARLRREQDRKRQEKEARNAEYDIKNAEYHLLLLKKRPDAENVSEMGRYAAALGRLEYLDYWFDHHHYER